MREPHRKFVEGFIATTSSTARSRSAKWPRCGLVRIVQMTGFSKTSDDLLRVVQPDNKVSIASDSDVMDRLHAFFIALIEALFCTFRNLRSGGMTIGVLLCFWQPNLSAARQDKTGSKKKVDNKKSVSTPTPPSEANFPCMKIF